MTAAAMTIETITTFRTANGRVFTDRSEAEAHVEVIELTKVADALMGFADVVGGAAMAPAVEFWRACEPPEDLTALGKDLEQECFQRRLVAVALTRPDALRKFVETAEKMLRAHRERGSLPMAAPGTAR